MTTPDADEKKPAHGGVESQVDGQQSVVPSTRRCVWVGPKTPQEHWALKSKLEEVLGRLDAILWALDYPENVESPERRRETLRHFATTGMQRALELEALLFERDPRDVPRQLETSHFDSFQRR